MAQQTINVGTAPNDGTGTPLRTAFQYTNSNFSELYTAVGPNGNNIVVPGNATITGDLTVDTSTLKVDSANNRVGIGTASPTETLHVSGGAGDGVIKVSNSSSGNSYIIARTTGEMDVFNVANSSIRFSTNGTLQATLNSTGLGVGVSPQAKIHIANASMLIETLSTQNKPALALGSLGAYYGLIQNDGTGLWSLGYGGSLTSLGTPVLSWNSSGNVGIGGSASATGIDTGVARLFVVAPNSNTGMAATFIADSVGRGLLVADQGKTNSFGVEIVAGLVKTGGFTSGTSVALFANAVERARVKSTGQVRFVPLAADPAGAEAGDVYYNSTSNKLKCYNGTTWNDLF